MCVCIYTYICICLCIYDCIHMYIYMYMYIYIYISIYILEPASPRVYLQVLIPGAHSFHIHLYMSMHVWLFVFVYAQTYPFIFLHAYSLLFSSSSLSLLRIHSLLLRPCSVHAPPAHTRLCFSVLTCSGPLYPAAGSHRLAKKSTCLAGAFNVPFHLSADGNTLNYDFPLCV